MPRHTRLFLLLVITSLLGCQTDSADQPVPEVPASPVSTPETISQTEAERAEQAEPKTAAVRQFRFIYAGTLSELEPGAEVSVWLPVATDTHEQQVLDREIEVPGEYVIGKEAGYGNTILHFTATANEQGEVPFQVVYHLTREEALLDSGADVSEEEASKFKIGTTFVPTDQQLSEQILKDTVLSEDPETAGRQIYDAVNLHMKYDKPEGEDWGRGDSVWACGNGFGNCTDFHSLFISVCREQKLPAKFEIGFALPTERGSGTVGGYHCWAKFAVDGKWVPVDISEADKDPTLTDYYYGNLTENRVTFTTGRDLTLNPAQQAGLVNFLIYPYAEVDGKIHTTFRKDFRFEDVQ